LKHRSFINQVSHQFRARPRLWLSLALGSSLYVGLPSAIASQGTTRFLVAWNVASLLYLVLTGIMMRRSNTDRMHARARMQDEGKIVVLTLVIVASVAVLIAIGSQLAAVKDMHGWQRNAHITLAAITVISSWAFTQTMLALHYAHDYYVARLGGGTGGLEFPGTLEPDYADFLYFACVIGTSGQTADVSFSTTRMRRIGLVHCVLAFFFNTTVLALTINIAASLF
jgi:uncharacterized membrane protein